MGKYKISDELANPTVSRQILHQLSISNGRYGKRVLNSTNKTSEPGEIYGYIMATEDSVIDSVDDLSISPESAQTLSNLTINAGIAIPGIFTNVVLDTGTVLCMMNKHAED